MSSDELTAAKARSRLILAKYESNLDGGTKTFHGILDKVVETRDKGRALELVPDIFGWIDQQDLDMLIELINSLS